MKMHNNKTQTSNEPQKRHFLAPAQPPTKLVPIPDRFWFSASMSYFKKDSRSIRNLNSYLNVTKRRYSTLQRIFDLRFHHFT